MSIDFIETLEELKGEVVNVNEEKSKILVKVKWNNTTNEKNITKQYLNKLDVLEGRSMTKNWNREIDGQDIIRTIKKNKKQQSKSPDLPG